MPSSLCMDLYRWIWIIYNMLTVVRRDPFADLDKLLVLRLDHNLLSVLPDGLCHNMKGLGGSVFE